MCAEIEVENGRFHGREDHHFGNDAAHTCINRSSATQTAVEVVYSNRANATKVGLGRRVVEEQTHSRKAKHRTSSKHQATILTKVGVILHVHCQRPYISRRRRRRVRSHHHGIRAQGMRAFRTRN
jgi:hypothetical protein